MCVSVCLLARAITHVNRALAYLMVAKDSHSSVCSVVGQQF